MGLRSWTVAVPGMTDLAATRARLAAAGVAVEADAGDGAVRARDRDGIAVRVSAPPGEGQEGFALDGGGRRAKGGRDGLAV